MKHSYTTAKGLLLDPTWLQHWLDELGKTEDECLIFFGERTWLAPGFANHWLEATVKTKKWCESQIR